MTTYYCRHGEPAESAPEWCTSEGGEYHEGTRIIRDAVDGGVLILCPLGHLYHHVRKGEWAGSMWEAEWREPVRCYGAMPEAVPA